MDLENLERIIDATVRKEEEESEKSLRPHRFEEYMGQEEMQEESEGLYSGGEAAPGASGPYFVLWAAGPGKDHAGWNH